MKFLKTTFLFFFICLFLKSFTSFSQSNDAIKMILSAKTFTISDQYNGDWGGYTHTYTFTKQKDNIEVVLETEMTDGKTSKSTTTITYEELKNIEKMFNNCVSKIKKTKKGSTEHSKYIFKSENTTYEIDDNTSMACVDDIRTWKKKYFPDKK